MKMLLGLLGFEVRLAFSGPEALASAAQWPPDAVICDIGLPGMNGFDVARNLRNGVVDGKTRLIALTGYGRDEDISAARAAGFDDFLVKPAAPNEILAKIAGQAR
jgi:CheY-like chemotaxis protein